MKAIVRAVHKLVEKDIKSKADSVGYKKDAADPGLAHGLALDIRRKIRGIMPKVIEKVIPAYNAMSSKVARSNSEVLQRVYEITPSKGAMANHISKTRLENVKLISNALDDYGHQIEQVLIDPDNFNRPVGDLMDLIEERGAVSSSRAELIARDQTLKLNGEINRVNQEGGGIDRYIWSTSQDERVRDSHADLEGEEFAWGERAGMDPPEPGQDFQCRCIAIPVLPEIESE